MREIHAQKTGSDYSRLPSVTGLEPAALSQKYCLNFEELSAIYENGLKHEYEDIDKLKIIINPLLHMLSLLPYILNLRIEQSKKLLNTLSLSVTEIALVCGFDNSNCFSTAFKRICGVTPSEYRRRSQYTR